MYKVKILENHTAGFKDARIGISLGQDYCQGDKLKSLCAWAADRFDVVEFMIADTLNVWNSRAGDSDVSDWTAEGQKWLETHREIINGIPRPMITRWDDLKEKHLGHYFPDVIDLYRSNGSFALEIDRFAQRIRIKRHTTADHLKYYRMYLLEEIAVNLGMGDKANIYPGSVFELSKYFDNAPTFTRVDFVRRKDQSLAA